MIRRAAIVCALGSLPVLFLLACEPSRPNGVGGAPDCSGDPFVCADGETCWPNDNVTKWDCIQAKAGQGPGSPCKLVGGQVSCDENLVCIVQGNGDGMGTCTPFCVPMSADHECGTGACVQFTINTASGTKFVVHACDPDGSTSTSSSSSGAGSTSAASSSSGG